MKRRTKIFAVIVMMLCITATMMITTFASINTSYTNSTSVIYSQNGLNDYIIVGRMPSNTSPNNNQFITTHGTLPREYYTTTNPSGQYFYDQSTPTNPTEIGSIISSPFYVNLNTKELSVAQLRLANNMYYTLNGQTTQVDTVHSISLRYKDFIIKENEELTQSEYRNASELGTIKVTDEQAIYNITINYTITTIKNGIIETINESYKQQLDGNTINLVTFNIIDFTGEFLTDPSSNIPYVPEEYISDNGECLVNEYVFTITNDDINKDTIDDCWITSTFDKNENENDVSSFYSDNGITTTIIETVEVDFSSWLVTSITAFTNFQIYPGITLGGIIGIFVAIAIVLAILKYYAGG